MNEYDIQTSEIKKRHSAVLGGIVAALQKSLNYKLLRKKSRSEFAEETFSWESCARTIISCCCMLSMFENQLLLFFSTFSVSFNLSFFDWPTVLICFRFSNICCSKYRRGSKEEHDDRCWFGRNHARCARRYGLLFYQTYPSSKKKKKKTFLMFLTTLYA